MERCKIKTPGCTVGAAKAKQLNYTDVKQQNFYICPILSGYLLNIRL
jgi:hypothetical protein